ncbi:MAG: type II secretion system protein GspL [Plesiomonas sp.]
MNGVLIIRLPAEATGNVSWLLWSKEQQKQLIGGELTGTDALNQLSDYHQHPLWVLVPGHQVSVRACTLPKGASKQAENLLPVLLEDDLAEDIDDLHFALLHRSGSEAQVAIIQRQKIEQWLAWLSAAGLKAQRLLPDWLALPLHADAISAVQLHDDWLIRPQQWQGFTAEETLLPPLFSALSHQAKSKAAEAPVLTVTAKSTATDHAIAENPNSEVLVPEPHAADHRLHVQSRSPLPHVLLPLVATLPLEWEATAFSHHQTVLELLTQGAQQAGATQKANLLTGDFAPQHAYQQQWQRWKQVAVAACVLLSLVFVDRGVQLWQLTRQADQAQSQAENAYRALFPQQKRLVNLRAQLNGVLRQMRGQPVMQGLIPRLRKVAETVTKEQQANTATSVRFMGMKYDRDRQTLRIQAKAADFAQLEQLRSALSNQFSVEQGQLSREAGQVVGTLTIKEKP